MNAHQYRFYLFIIVNKPEYEHGAANTQPFVLCINLAVSSFYNPKQKKKFVNLGFSMLDVFSLLTSGLR